MKTPSRLALASAALFMLSACDRSTPVDPSANLTENVVIDPDQAIAPVDPPASDQASQPANQEPNMQSDPTSPPPARPTTPPPAKEPAPPPRRVILPAPVQPPAEVDPVQPYPGDEVPR